MRFQEYREAELRNRDADDSDDSDDSDESKSSEVGVSDIDLEEDPPFGFVYEERYTEREEKATRWRDHLPVCVQAFHDTHYHGAHGEYKEAKRLCEVEDEVEDKDAGYGHLTVSNGWKPLVMTSFTVEILTPANTSE